MCLNTAGYTVHTWWRLKSTIGIDDQADFLFDGPPRSRKTNAGHVVNVGEEVGLTFRR